MNIFQINLFSKRCFFNQKKKKYFFNQKIKIQKIFFQSKNQKIKISKKYFFNQKIKKSKNLKIFFQ
jgi:hypothetical protein